MVGECRLVGERVAREGSVGLLGRVGVASG